MDLRNYQFPTLPMVWRNLHGGVVSKHGKFTGPDTEYLS